MELLTTPTTVIGRDFRIESLYLNWATSHIEISLVSSDGGRNIVKYDGVAASTLLKSLNTANLAVSSLHKRILQKLNADGLLVGAISGVPDA